MTLVFDTSALIRFFTNDQPQKALQIKALLEDNSKSIYIPDVVFPELEYVLLGHTHQASRSKILTAFQYLNTKKNIKLSKTLRAAIHLYETSPLDIADCIIVSSSSGKKLISFDQKMLNLHKKL